MSGIGSDRRDGSRSRSRFTVFAAVYLVGLAVYAAVSWPHTHPPYIDSFYYVDIARNLAAGRGFTEGFVWNYLGGTPSLPHAAGAYWLPGLSVLLASAYLLGMGYHGAAVTTAAVAALCPVVAAVVARDVWGTWRHALAAGALTLFNGVWFHDWATPDAFVPAAALTALSLLCAARGLQRRGPWRGGAALALAGAGAGLTALTRQEGVLLLPALLVAAVLTRQARQWRWLWPRALGALGAYATVQAPWLLHNLAVYGSVGAPGGTRTLWMRSYDAFYSLHTAALTARAYLDWGAGNILAARLHAVVFELEVWAALWLVLLVPPLLLGLWALRGCAALRPALCYWAVLAAAMPLLFTATIEHGTLLHASGGLLPWASVLVVAGLDRVALLGRLSGRAGGTPRPMPEGRARALDACAVLTAAAISLYMTAVTFPARGDEYTADARVVTWLHAHGGRGAVTMVLDPPLYSYLDGGPYVVTPSDGLDAVREVVRHYGVRYWALDPQNRLYPPAGRRLHVSWLRFLTALGGVQLYQVRQPSGSWPSGTAGSRVARKYYWGPLSP